MRKAWYKKGRFSKDIISRDELMYNRKNWRDLSKKKAETREEFEMRIEIEKDKQNAYVKYTLNKAKNIIKNYIFQKVKFKMNFCWRCKRYSSYLYEISISRNFNLYRKFNFINTNTTLYKSSSE